MRTISELELRRRMASVLRVVERGGELTITRDGEPIARLVPLAANASLSKRVQVRRKRVTQPVAAFPTSDDLEGLLTSVKERRRELFEAMKSARARRGDEEQHELR